jgi:hypothetical protein
MWVAFIGLGVTWVALLLLWLALRNELTAIRTALRIADGQPIDRMLIEHLESRKAMQAEIAELRERLQASEEWMDHAISYASIVRYDAFENVSGNQSFAIALQNSKGDGILINAVSGRDQARIYGKSVSGGISDGTLTPEEKQAIIKALTRAKS